MHLYAISRGHKPRVDEWISDLQAIWLPFDFTHPITKEKQNLIKLGIRPIQLWEFIFPKEHLEIMSRTIIHTPHAFSKKEEFFVKQFRKLLKAKEVPKFNEEGKKYFTLNTDVEVTPIGIKEDETAPGGYEQL